MTSTVVHNGEGHPWPGGVKEIIISCDAEGCGKAYNNTEIERGGGLKHMGWSTVFDEGERVQKHYCPDHTTVTEGREL